MRRGRRRSRRQVLEHLLKHALALDAGTRRLGRNVGRGPVAARHVMPRREEHHYKQQHHGPLHLSPDLDHSTLWFLGLSFDLNWQIARPSHLKLFPCPTKIMAASSRCDVLRHKPSQHGYQNAVQVNPLDDGDALVEADACVNGTQVRVALLGGLTLDARTLRPSAAVVARSLRGRCTVVSVDLHGAEARKLWERERECVP